MKQIISFRREIPFSTKIGEITSISLEHALKMIENDHIMGEFIVSGNYKITDISINKEPFSYNLPFDIALDTKYNIEKAKVDIDDFYYEILNDRVLCVNIDILIDSIELQSVFNIERESDNMPEPTENNKKTELDLNVTSSNEEREVIDLFKEIETPAIDIAIGDSAIPLSAPEFKTSLATDEKIKSLFDSFDDSTETFTTYHVHIVRETDTIDTIVEKYHTTKEEIAAYNKIDELKLGDKIVIPASQDE